MSNALIDLVISHGYDTLMKEHMQIFMVNIGGKDAAEILNSTANAENWIKVFNKFKDFLLIAICDE